MGESGEWCITLTWSMHKYLSFYQPNRPKITQNPFIVHISLSVKFIHITKTIFTNTFLLYCYPIHLFSTKNSVWISCFSRPTRLPFSNNLLHWSALTVWEKTGLHCWARVRSQVRSGGIYGGQSGIGAGFLQVLRFACQFPFHQLLHIHLTIRRCIVTIFTERR
jgi:hypothetical protein